MRPISEDDLTAYVDRALDARRHKDVQAYLEQHSDVKDRVEEDMRQREWLRSALAPIAQEPIPARLSVAGMIEGNRAPAQMQWRAVAAAVLLMVSGGAGGWLLNDYTSRPTAGIASLAAEAADSFAVFAADRGRPTEIAASDSRQLVSWASQRLDRPVAIPDLSSAGFTFIGGRLVATPHGPAALYMFDNGSGTRIVMLSRNMAIDKNAPMRRDSKRGLNAASWSRDGLGYSVVGPLASDHLINIAAVARQQV
ncbi:anti-sigma factor family protein [Aurantiacibacter luteus]|uniref:Anti-sigma factor n=1 Tax=Aurantiacibacter luteus TaxID=1581420 RepID=A0A0G9MP76_9SPHN|nr:anti-sigma factor [Aurantiacibacter luteus]KLE32394.1 hypothetical protein AAW00_13210 [Aurantiacibacter luteus]